MMLTEVKKREAEDLPKAGQVDMIFAKTKSKREKLRIFQKLGKWT